MDMKYFVNYAFNQIYTYDWRLKRKQKFNMKEKLMEWLDLNMKENSPLLTKQQYDKLIDI